jgi:uncharacterized protein DUF4241
MMSAVHPDFDGALVRAEVVAAGLLKLPSGRLVAAEPPGLFPPGEVADWSYTETVPPGEYPVEVVRGDCTVMAARVIVNPDPVHDWRPARCVAHPEWEHCFFPVDGGTGSFGSVEVFEHLAADPEAREDFIADASFGSDDPYVTYADDETGHNLVCFGLGGDGRFETWVGYTEAGEVACFLTDYANLAREQGQR